MSTFLQMLIISRKKTELYKMSRGEEISLALKKLQNIKGKVLVLTRIHAFLLIPIQNNVHYNQ